MSNTIIDEVARHYEMQLAIQQEKERQADDLAAIRKKAASLRMSVADYKEYLIRKIRQAKEYEESK